MLFPVSFFLVHSSRAQAPRLHPRVCPAFLQPHLCGVGCHHHAFCGKLRAVERRTGARLVGLAGMSWVDRLSNALYFSVITATSVGYGDIVPLGFAKIFASVQAAISLLVFTVLVSKIVSQRQELALEQIHRLAFEEFLHNLREGLFIIRKDCDRLLARARAGEPVSEKDWLDTEAAFRQGQTHLDEIPEFFAPDAGLYVIDPKREELLFEAIERTVQRLDDLLVALAEAKVLAAAPQSWREQLDVLLADAERSAEGWHRRTPRAAMRSAIEALLPRIAATRVRMHRS